jgi:hypothetical protein
MYSAVFTLRSLLWDANQSLMNFYGENDAITQANIIAV